jgi:glucose dehydrogenase
MRVLKATLLACLAGASLFAQASSRSTSWETYGGDSAGRRYSPLTQIDTRNVSKL